jgi:hypothetical protein
MGYAVATGREGLLAATAAGWMFATLCPRGIPRCSDHEPHLQAGQGDEWHRVARLALRSCLRGRRL